jgi:hypothetical protein
MVLTQIPFMQKTLIILGLIILGLIILGVGLAWPWLGSIPLGRLPGDIIIERENFRFYLPITTMLLVSGLLSLVLWLLYR